jgi:hypothetical protein
MTPFTGDEDDGSDRANAMLAAAIEQKARAMRR